MLKGKNLVILIAAILIILLGFVIVKFSKNEDSSNPSFTTKVNENTVLMLEKGFEPEKIVVKAGSKVTFINKDKVFRWPASDLHPTHTIYPEFDPKGPIKPGDSWEFTFNKAGLWNYHDHLSPLLTGKIVVE